MISHFHRGLNAVGGRRDLVVVILLVTAILMMILPLPTWLVDMLIAVNLAAAILLLMMALYLKEPLDFSTLPSVILIVTIFRLALSITTTRLILLQADAGRIVESFGEFVIAGNIIVGLVIFLIITVVQFVVITKGAERVAEVSARFTLDALPGKQMSIDADLRNGDIDQAEARSRRRTLEKESQFYGAMDGAMKFVKGDAIAGLVIIAVNLLGGIAVGMFQQGMSAGGAASIYSLLTIGDGLAAQLPALFVSLAAGSIVTRVATENAENLGTDITTQMFESTLSVRVAAVVIALIGFVPGFPLLVFLAIAALFMALSFSDRIRTWIFGVPEDEESTAQAADEEDAFSPFLVRVDPSMAERAQADFTAGAREEAAQFNTRMGVSLAPARLEGDPSLAAGAVRVELDDVPVAQFSLNPGSVAVSCDAETLSLAGIEPLPGDAPPPGFERLYWVPADAAPKLTAEGVPVMTPAQVLVRATMAAQRRYASHCVGVQETRAALSEMAGQYPDLASEARERLPLNKMAEVFRRLVEEDVPIRNRRLLLESIAEWGAKEQDPVVLTEYVRTALKRQICNQIAGEDNVIPAYLLDREAEEVVRGAIRQTTVGEYLALDDVMSSRLVDAIKASIRQPKDGATQPIVLASLDVRRFVRSILANNGMRDTPVLSYNDLSPEFTVAPLATITPGGALSSA